MRSFIALASAALLAAPPLVAQSAAPHVNQHKGFWIGFGLGGGSVGAECDYCGNDRTSGLSGNLKLGGTLSQSFLLGFESNGWVHSESGVDELLGFGSFIGVWYPSKTAGFYLKLGLGGMNYSADDGVDKLTATAPSGSFGLGYDLRATDNMSVTFYLNSMASSSVDVHFNGITVNDVGVSVNLVQIGVGLTWH